MPSRQRTPQSGSSATRACSRSACSKARCTGCSSRARCTDPEPLAAEMLGRATGVCGSRAGSMNVIDLEHGLVGCFGIVGGSIAAATGAALTAKREGGVAAAFFGDGAVNQAYFHECLNFASVYALPMVFVCENNFYGEFTPMASVTAGGSIAARA